MAIREIREVCPEFQKPETKWHNLKCKLITPLYGGGVESSIIDKKMPIRGTEVRGQLRFWWRLLAKNIWMKEQSDKEIQKAEFALWGGGTSEQFTSKVFVKVTDISPVILKSYTEYAPKNSVLSYVFFPADNDKDDNKQVKDCFVLKEDFTWTLSIKFAKALTDDLEKKNQVFETLRWWSQFGGIGARSRRGTGALIIENADKALKEVLNPVTEDDARQVGCTLVLKNGQNNAITAWETAITKLKDFRQAPNVGRNQGQQTNHPGRSRWPEPDAIRYIQNKHGPKHEPEHKAGNIFPRGLFGMPIIYHFVGKDEPSDTELCPIGKERMTSPLIMRPYYDRANQKYQPMALLLPYQHLLSKEVDLKGSRADKVKLWDDSKADLIQPVKDNNGTNPLEAFMNFFQKG